MQSPSIINAIAEDYVKLSLAIGQHCPNYVDAYYGPSQWQQQARKIPLAQLQTQAQQLINQAKAIIEFTDNEQAQRLNFLLIHLKASAVYIEMLLGNTLDFYSECEALYDAKPPKYDEQHFDKINQSHC